MSNLKDTDIDDLFRRASDKYPLRTDSADWDRMAGALDKEPPFPPDDAVDAGEKRRKRRFFWLFLLLPLAGAGYYALHHAGSTSVDPSHATVHATASAPSNASAPSTPSTGSDQATASAPSTTAAASTTSATSVPSTTSTPSTASAAGVHPGPAFADHPGRRFADRSLNRNNTTKGNNKRNNNSTEDTKPDNSLSLTAVNTRQQPGSGKVGSDPSGGNSLVSLNSTGENDRLFYDLQRALIPHDYNLSVDVKAPEAKKDSTKPKSRTAHMKHFYAGILGAPDLSTVKMQTVKGVGSTYSLLLGYTFNGGHWAIETGISVDRKKYYTDGEYFNTKEMRLPPNADLLSVNGVCYMWEIPLNVRYNFNPGAKTAWFATTGLSTYLMTRENYVYDWKYYNGATTWPDTKNLKNPSQYPFSIVNLSAGFEQRLGKIGNLRVEPYVRLPLTGLGTGKLSIMSAGVNIGITRQLW